MRKFPIALTALFMFGGAAHAQCTPEGMARHRAVIAQQTPWQTGLGPGIVR